MSGNDSASKLAAYWISPLGTCFLFIPDRTTHRCRDISASNPFDRCIEIIKRFTLDNLCADFATNTESGEATLNDDETKNTVN